MTDTQEPAYEFYGNELRAAQRMAAKGWLKELKGNRFKIKVAGEKALQNFMGF